MKIIGICLLLTLTHVVCGQNLVPNSSFELYTNLPDDGGQWDRVMDWNNAGGSPVQGYYGNPDYFHTAGSGIVSLPHCALADVYPHSGSGIMGFLGYHAPGVGSTNIREYLQVQLTSPMSIDQEYEVAFWTTNGDSGIGHYLQCDGIGIALSINPLVQSGTGFIAGHPQMVIPGELFTTAWTQHVFSFVADSNYRFLTIGNFVPDSVIATSVALPGPLPFEGAYYFVDDFSVQVPVANAVPKPSRAASLTLSPNPTAGQVVLTLPPDWIGEASYTLHTLQGQALQTGRVRGTGTIDLAHLPAGTYILKVSSAHGILERRIVRQ